MRLNKNKTDQSKAKQSKAKQSKAKQSKAKRKDGVSFGVTIDCHNVIPSNTLTVCVSVHN